MLSGHEGNIHSKKEHSHRRSQHDQNCTRQRARYQWLKPPKIKNLTFSVSGVCMVDFFCTSCCLLGKLKLYSLYCFPLNIKHLSLSFSKEERVAKESSTLPWNDVHEQAGWKTWNLSKACRMTATNRSISWHGVREGNFFMSPSLRLVGKVSVPWPG